MQIVRTMGKANEVPVKKILSAQILQKCRAAVDAITADEKILQYIVSLITVTRPAQDQSSAQHRNDILRYISFGASPRAGIALLKCAKVNALFENRSFVLPEDVQAVAIRVLSHRLVLSYEASADNVTANDLIAKIVDLMPVP